MPAKPEQRSIDNEEKHTIVNLYFLLAIIIITYLLLLNPQEKDPEAVVLENIAGDFFRTCETGSVILVKPNDTIYEIAKNLSGSTPLISDFERWSLMREMLDLNPHLGNEGNLIYPGQLLTIPPSKQASKFAQERNQGRFPSASGDSENYLEEFYPEIASSISSRADVVLKFIESEGQVGWPNAGKDFCIFAAFRFPDENSTQENIERVLRDYETWVRNDDMLRYWAEWAQINAQQINNLLANLSVDARINPDLYGQTVFLPKPDTVVDIAAGTSNQTTTSAGETMGGDFLLWFYGSGLMQNLASTIDPYEDPWINQGIRRGMQHEMIHLQQDGESLGALGRGQQNFLHAAMGLITLPIHDLNNDYLHPDLVGQILDVRVQYIMMKIHQHSNADLNQLYARFAQAIINGHGAEALIDEYEHYRKRDGSPEFTSMFSDDGPPDPDTMLKLLEYLRSDQGFMDYINLLTTAQKLARPFPADYQQALH